MIQIKKARHSFLLLSSLLLISCGGGGGSGSGSNIGGNSGAPVVPLAPTYEVSAAFVKGLVDGASCELFEIDSAGSQGNSVATGTTSNGSINFGSNIEYQGAALISCTGGTYYDEATGTTLSAPTTRSVVNIDGDGSFTVTPLTEIATQRALADGDLEMALTTHNEAVAEAFGIEGDITQIMPTDLETTAASNDEAGQYATALALISVLDDNSDGELSSLVEELATDFADGMFSSETAADLAEAQTDLANAAVSQNLNDDAVTAVSDALGDSSDAVIPDPVIPDPVIPDPVVPDPVIPDPVIPDPVDPDPVDPDSNTGDTKLVSPADVYVDPQGNIDANGEGFTDDTIACGMDAPSTRFDFSDWYISTPKEGDPGDDQSIYEAALMGGYIDSDLFCLGRDNGLVLKTTVAGFKTSANTQYTRTELREMLREGNTSIDNKDLANNWAFSNQPEATRNAAAAVDGTLKATLAINRVTTTYSGDNEYQVGRMIMGQIHAKNDEPIRLYYRKLPDNVNGSVYFATEENGGDDTYIRIIGSRSSSQSDPVNGIPLNEPFAYEIRAVGEKLYVTITKADGTVLTPLDGDNDDGLVNEDGSVDMVGYGIADDYMYFKLGIYTGNSTGDDTDYDQVTFYSFDNIH
jgi:hypothetical protein